MGSFYHGYSNIKTRFNDITSKAISGLHQVFLAFLSCSARDISMGEYFSHKWDWYTRVILTHQLAKYERPIFCPKKWSTSSLM